MKLQANFLIEIGTFRFVNDLNTEGILFDLILIFLREVIPLAAIVVLRETLQALLHHAGRCEGKVTLHELENARQSLLSIYYEKDCLIFWVFIYPDGRESGPCQNGVDQVDLPVPLFVGETLESTLAILHDRTKEQAVTLEFVVEGNEVHRVDGRKTIIFLHGNTPYYKCLIEITPLVLHQDFAVYP
jgi:hypothetical protein